MMPHTLTATLDTSVAGSPKVTLTFTGIQAGTLLVERRTAAGWDAVRGYDSITVTAGHTGGIIREVPQNTALQYRSTLTLTTGGVETVTANATGTLDLGGDWLYSTDGRGGNQVTVVDVSELVYKTNTEVVDVIGRPDRIAVGDVLQWPDVTLTLATFTAAERNSLRALLASGGVVGFAPRHPADVGVDEELWYLAVVGVAERRAARLAQEQTRIWELRCSRAAAPAGLA
jgi:hypothetical protein